MPDPLTDEIINDCLIMRTRLIARTLTGIYDDALLPVGINSAQFILLAIISRLQPASRSDVGRFAKLDRSTLSRNIELLESSKWIEEVDSAAAGRRRPVRLTPAGRKILHASAPAWREAQTQAAAALGKDGVKTVMRVAGDLLNA